MGGVIAAGDPQTARAGAELLRAGGNAVDAVCAAAFASFVCEAPLTSPAGAGLLLYGTPSVPWTVLDFFADTPGVDLASRPEELDFREVLVDFGPTRQSFHVGRGAAAVPGGLFGLLRAARDARFPLHDLVAPAVRLARQGYRLSSQLEGIVRLLEPILTHTPGVRTLFCRPDGSLPFAGDRLRNPALADLLLALSTQGEAFIRGPFAEALHTTCGPHRGGLITAADLARYQPVHRPPLRVRFREREVLLVPPPASGGRLVAYGLQLADQRGLDDLLHGRSAEAVLELAALLSAVSAARASGDDYLGSTTHISVLDDDGGAASLTMSNGEGCGHALDAFGVHVNNFLGEEDINPAGFHKLPPATRMTTMMAPTIVLRDGSPEWVMGSGGSNRIRSALTLGLIDALGSGRTPTEVVELPRLHVEGTHVWYEREGLEPDAAAALEAAHPGATGFDRQHMFFGGLHVAARPSEQAPGGAGDARRGGAVVVV